MPDLAFTGRSGARVARKPCVICGATDRVHELAIDQYAIFRCACGLRTLFPEPAAADLVDAFDDGSIYGEAATLREDIYEQNARSLRHVENVVKPGRLLDVGFGLGFMLEVAKARGWEAVGVDPSPFSVQRARENGFEAHRGMLADARLASQSFDVVSLLQVVEHALDFRDLFLECHRLLRPGGAILVETPNPASLLARVKREGFNYWIPPIHCVWYTPDALARALSASGFAPVKVGTWSARSPRLHDGVDIVASTKLGRHIPRRLHATAGSIVASLADMSGRGSIVEVIAVRTHRGACA